MKNGVLTMMCLFGRAKAGLEFKSEKDVNNYACDDFGEGVVYSQNRDPVSPYVRKVGKVKRDANWNKSVCIL